MFKYSYLAKTGVVWKYAWVYFAAGLWARKEAILEEGSVVVAFAENNHQHGAFSSKSLDASNKMFS